MNTWEEYFQIRMNSSELFAKICMIESEENDLLYKSIIAFIPLPTDWFRFFWFFFQSVYKLLNFHSNIWSF